MNTKKYIFCLYILPLFLAISSCSGPYECVPDADEQAMITWGVVTGNADSFEGYAMMTNGKIYQEDWDNDTPLLDTEISLSEEEYCNFRDELLALYKETQATNQPADTTHYMEYMVPQRNLKLRARWNPKFDNVGNEKWKNLWNKLQLLMEKHRNNL